MYIRHHHTHVSCENVHMFVTHTHFVLKYNYRHLLDKMSMRFDNGIFHLFDRVKVVFHDQVFNW